MLVQHCLEARREVKECLLAEYCRTMHYVMRLINHLYHLWEEMSKSLQQNDRFEDNVFFKLSEYKLVQRKMISILMNFAWGS